ncbi:MAG: hypothetical protein FWF60_08125 [Oscillospiraceae bacterium]|nr:hypothetical protein [Oscillospiraceae bacterium]
MGTLVVFAIAAFGIALLMLAAGIACLVIGRRRASRRLKILGRVSLVLSGLLFLICLGLILLIGS